MYVLEKTFPLIVIREQNIIANLMDDKIVEPAESKLKKFKSLILDVPRNRLWCSSKVSLHQITFEYIQITIYIATKIRRRFGNSFYEFLINEMMIKF